MAQPSDMSFFPEIYVTQTSMDSLFPSEYL